MGERDAERSETRYAREERRASLRMQLHVLLSSQLQHESKLVVKIQKFVTRLFELGWNCAA